jgi:hypothetical protein
VQTKGRPRQRVCETTCLDIVGLTLSGVVGGRGRHARNVLNAGICWVSSGYAAAMQVKETGRACGWRKWPKMQDAGNQAWLLSNEEGKG